MDIVSKHLALWRRTPFVWGTSDCMLSIADYLAERLGRDCAGQFRGRYSTRLGCMRVSGFHRDPVKPMADCIAEYPLAETTAPVRGDVGLVDAGGGIIAAALCLGAHWAMRGERGITVGAPAAVLRAWSV